MHTSKHTKMLSCSQPRLLLHLQEGKREGQLGWILFPTVFFNSVWVTTPSLGPDSNLSLSANQVPAALNQLQRSAQELIPPERGNPSFPAFGFKINS